MKSNYKRLGDYIRQVDVRNKDLRIKKLLGINIDKFFMPSVANIIGTDLSNYKLIEKGQFACNPMHVGRDERIPVSLYLEEDYAIVSPAYFVFEITNTSLLSKYLMLWFKRPEFDRECWFYTDASVRGGITWEDFCDMRLPIPSIEEQQKIVDAYETIEKRIAIKKKINENLLNVLLSLFEREYEPKNDNASMIKLSEIIDFGNGKTRPNSIGIYPVYGGNGIISYANQYNNNNVVVIGRVGAYCGSIYLEQSLCWVSDNAICAKSKLSDKEYYDYFLLKKLDLFNYHVGTGQPLLTQQILNNIEICKPCVTKIENFNKKAENSFNILVKNQKEVILLEKLNAMILTKLIG